MNAAKFPLFVHWPDYTEDQQCYIRQDVADELYAALDELLHNGTKQTHVLVEQAEQALAKARGEQVQA